MPTQKDQAEEWRRTHIRTKSFFLKKCTEGTISASITRSHHVLRCLMHFCCQSLRKPSLLVDNQTNSVLLSALQKISSLAYKLELCMINSSYPTEGPDQVMAAHSLMACGIMTSTEIKHWWKIEEEVQTLRLFQRRLPLLKLLFKS